MRDHWNLHVQTDRREIELTRYDGTNAIQEQYSLTYTALPVLKPSGWPTPAWFSLTAHGDVECRISWDDVGNWRVDALEEGDDA